MSESVCVNMCRQARRQAEIVKSRKIQAAKLIVLLQAKYRHKISLTLFRSDGSCDIYVDYNFQISI